MWTKTFAINRIEDVALGCYQLEQAPQIVFVFGLTKDFIASPCLKLLKSQFPKAHLIGCSTGTVVHGNSLSHEGVFACCVGFEHTKVQSACVQLKDYASGYEAAHALGTALMADDLKAVFILSDGLKVNGSDLVKGITSVLGADVKVSGGLAGDGAHFKETYVLLDDAPQSAAITAIGLYGDHVRLSNASVGGWDEFGPKRTITRADANVLYELDGKPALDLYQRYLGEEADQLPASGLTYPLLINDPENPDQPVIRTLLSVDHETRSLTFAGDVPQGWSARLMRGQFDRLVQGASDAAQFALKTLQDETPGLEPSLCLMVSCVGRHLLMGQRTQDEVQAISSVMGEAVGQIGFYSYGEIAPHNATNFCDLHNQTMTLTLIGEAA